MLTFKYIMAIARQRNDFPKESREQATNAMPEGFHTILLGKQVTFKCPDRDPYYYGDWVGTIESVYFKDGECWVTLSSTDFYDVKLSQCQIHNPT